MARGITGWDAGDENAEPKRTVSYSAAQDSMRISLFDGPTRDSLVFKGVSYRDANEMHRAVVADWLSAGGELCLGDVWGLGKFPWFSRDELIGAFEWAKANPQSVFEDEDDI
jgi:hypothetical protein